MIHAITNPDPIRIKHNKIVIQKSAFVIFAYRLCPTSIGPAKTIGFAIAIANRPQITIQNKTINIFLSFLFIIIIKVVIRKFAAN